MPTDGGSEARVLVVKKHLDLVKKATRKDGLEVLNMAVEGVMNQNGGSIQHG